MAYSRVRLDLRRGHTWQGHFSYCKGFRSFSQEQRAAVRIFKGGKEGGNELIKAELSQWPGVLERKQVSGKTWRRGMRESLVQGWGRRAGVVTPRMATMWTL